MRRLKTVIHVHTDYSYDSNQPCEELIATARRQGVDCVAVTDHDDIAGALRTREIGGVDVIVGEEISTAGGHLIGLFLTSVIPPGLPIEETIARIREQGGLVLAPHPRAVLCESSIRRATLERVCDRLDAVEVCNGQNPLLWENGWARRFARRRGITPYVGADAHVRGELAACWQMLPPFRGPGEFLAALREAELVPGRFGLRYFAVMGGRHVYSKLTGRELSGFGVNTGLPWTDRGSALPDSQGGGSIRDDESAGGRRKRPAECEVAGGKAR